MHPVIHRLDRVLDPPLPYELHRISSPEDTALTNTAVCKDGAVLGTTWKRGLSLPVRSQFMSLVIA